MLTAPLRPRGVKQTAHRHEEVWTCPMHPDVVRDQPGPCPSCGMALEPRTPGAAENPELTDMRRRFHVEAEHVLAHRARRVDVVSLQRGRGARAGGSAGRAPARRPCAALLRSCGGH